MATQKTRGLRSLGKKPTPRKDMSTCDEERTVLSADRIPSTRSSLISPINFSVMCIPSGRTHLAEGHMRRSLLQYCAIAARTESFRSIATKSLIAVSSWRPGACPHQKESSGEPYQAPSGTPATSRVHGPRESSSRVHAAWTHPQARCAPDQQV